MKQLGALDRSIVVLAVVAIALGIALRVAFLDRPLFWQDETATAIRATGHDEGEFAKLFDGGTHPVADVLGFVGGGDAGPGATATALARAEPHRTPLYFLLCALWVRVFGTSVVAFRALSVVFGVAGIALAYGFATALTKSRRAGAIGAALVALSPLFVLYARQAREYALLYDAMLAASWALIVAWRGGGTRTWLTYVLCAIAGLYTDVVFVALLAAHGAGTLARAASDKAWTALAGWSLAAGVATASVVPWFLYTARAGVGARVEDQLAWARTYYPLKFQLLKWGFNLGALGFDGEYRVRALALLAVLAVVIAVAGIVCALLRDNLETRALLGAMLAVPVVAFVGFDLVQHAHFSTVPRFMFATWCTLEIALAVTLAALLDKPRTRYVAFAAFGAMLALGFVAGALRDGAENWWDDNDDLRYQSVARVANAVPAPNVYTVDRGRGVLVFARYLRPDATLTLFTEGSAPPRAPQRGDFLLEPSDAFLANVRARCAATCTVRNVSPPFESAIAEFQQTVRQQVRPGSHAIDLANAAANALWQVTNR